MIHKTEGVSYLNDEQLEIQKKQDIEVFENDIKVSVENWPDHKKKEFTFTILEQQLLAQQDTILALAERTKLAVINELALRRVNIDPNPGIKLRYHIGLGRFVLFIPKVEKTVKSEKN